LKALWNRERFSTSQNERTPIAVVGGNQAVVNSQPTAQVYGPGLIGDERIGAGFDAVTGNGARPDDASQPRSRFQENQIEGTLVAVAQFLQMMSRRQPGQPSSDDSHPPRRMTHFVKVDE
jgi:hypothetical protein